MKVFAPRTAEEFHRDFASLTKIFQSGTHYIAGFVSYEAGYFLEEQFAKFRKTFYDKEIFHLSVYENAIHSTREAKIHTHKDATRNFQFSITEENYSRKLESIQKFLQEGESYQINFTFPVAFRSELDPRDLYQFLQSKQRVAYSCFMDKGTEQILCISPELFLEYSQGKILSKPMKGTAKRSALPEIDEWIAHSLQHSEKNRAENLMITDLIRNDLGKYSKLGSVKVKSLFDIETFETIHQMTSSIESTIQSDLTIWDVFWGMFPCGSVTGAPKIRSMEIIHELENSERGVYTGSMGYFAPMNSQKASQWNIAIRTIEYNNGNCRMGIGSGITIDSDSMDEWKECKSKMQFIGLADIKNSIENYQFTLCGSEDMISDDFKLFESIGWNGKSFKLLKLHTKRLEQSARYFGIPFDSNQWISNLQAFAENKKNESGRIKYNLYPDGSHKIIFFPLDINHPDSSRIRISENAIHSDTLYLYHKTSHRKIYDEIYKQRGEYYDIVFVNERMELTESCVHNLFVKIDGIYYTPSIDSGLLRGTLREYCLKKFPKWFKEKILYIEDLEKADRIALGNSVRGFKECIY